MKCPICAEETAGQETQQWGPEWAHQRCVKAYSLGGCDARAAVEANSVPDGRLPWTVEKQDDLGVIFDSKGNRIATCYGKAAREVVKAHNAALSSAPPVAQPAEQDWETRAELAEQQVVCLSEERDHFRNLYEQRKAQPAERKPLAAQQLDKAAKALAECMDYPWALMPEQGREQMRKNALAVIAAANGIGD